MPRRRMKSGEIETLLPTDEEIWAARETVTWKDWAERTGLVRSTIGRRLATRGWRKQCQTGRITVAPCRECGSATPVEDLTEDRVCSECMADESRPDPDVLRFRQELQAWKKRQRENGRHLRRSYTPPPPRTEALRIHRSDR